jgi:hypothetical protein
LDTAGNVGLDRLSPNSISRRLTKSGMPSRIAAIKDILGTFHAKKTNRWRGQNLLSAVKFIIIDQNIWSVYWKIHKEFNAKFSDFSCN